MSLSVSFNKVVTQNDSQSTALGGAGGKTSAINKNVQTTLTEGTGAGNADITLQTQVTLNATNSYEATLDLFAGSLVDEFGTAFQIKEVKGLYFETITTGSVNADCEVFADQTIPANEFKGPINDVAGSGYVIPALEGVAMSKGEAGGWTVDATHKLLTFRNNNSTDTVINVMIAGVKI